MHNPEQTRTTTVISERVLLATFTATVLLAAALLFLVQPMVAKMLLPLLGGSPSVWNTAMVFFQAVLLAGYAFAHLSLTRLGTRRQPVVQAALLCLPLLVLPITLPQGWRLPEGASPDVWVLLALATMVGLPFFLLSTVSPTLQRWFSATSHPLARDPYFLYAAGNAGSFLALLSYPFVLEPRLSLEQQSKLWMALYLAFAVLSLVCIALLRIYPADKSLQDQPLRDAGVEVSVDRSDVITGRMRLRWIFFAAVPSALMLGVTHHIATDVASMPLLWVVPLSLYLLTFVIAFGSRPSRSIAIAARAFKLLSIPLALTFLGLVANIWIGLGLHLCAFSAAAVVAHGRLSAERPEPSRLTEFYLLLSLGGVTGGIFAALVAPIVFSSILEYPLTIVLALAILPASAFTNGDNQGKSWRDSALRTATPALALVAVTVASLVARSAGTQQALTVSMLIAACALGGAYVLSRRPITFAVAIAFVLASAEAVPANPTNFQERTFFGVHRVYDDKANDNRHVLLNGTTVHGMENVSGASAGEPLTYYHRSGPIGQYFATTSTSRSQQVGLVGLGSGAIATYGRAGDTMTYYEIDEAVIRIARDRQLFTFVSNSKAQVDFALGDGRLELEAQTAKRFDLLVLDAFSSDAIPLHLMTNEAMALYVDRITEHGVIAFHISNRYFDFAPILERLAREQHLVGIINNDSATPEQAAEGKLDSTWVLLARSTDDLGALATDGRWRAMGNGGDAPLWTDQFNDLLHVFRWNG